MGSVKLNIDKGVAIGIGDDRKRHLSNSHYLYPCLVLQWVGNLCLRERPQPSFKEFLPH